MTVARSSDQLPALLAFLSQEFAAGSAVEPTQRLVPDLVDSLGVFVLVDFVEQQWGVVVDDRDLNVENLATPQAFCRLIQTKLGTVRNDSAAPC